MLMLFAMLIDDTSDMSDLDVFYRKYRQNLMKYTRKLFYSSGKVELCSCALVEDLVGECFLKITENMDEFEGMDEVGRIKWVTVIQRNIVFDHLRREKKQMTVEIDPYLDNFEDEKVDSSEAWERAEKENAQLIREDDIWSQLQNRQIVRLIRKLPSKDRDLLEKKYVFGYNNRQIAAIYQVPESTIGTWLQRGRFKLKELMIKEGIDYV